MLRMVKRLMALSLGTQRAQLEQRTGLTWPRPFLLRPLKNQSVTVFLKLALQQFQLPFQLVRQCASVALFKSLVESRVMRVVSVGIIAEILSDRRLEWNRGSLGEVWSYLAARFLTILSDCSKEGLET